jgi:hypothetical protein
MSIKSTGKEPRESDEPIQAIATQFLAQTSPDY